ncbi:putative Selenide; water dikinase [Paratrimastix pyriformis]|uniref:Selenide n=1 Tax=Paratrimastix pyriformis TaxID=342808 RepID=A0ABQ8UND8_9EUKA|nr:putative Selenide; water dikinase [Paratrimastix pyriformis]
MTSCFAPSSATSKPSQTSAATVFSPSPSGTAATPIPEPDKVKLSQYASGLGCACKLKPQALEQVLRHLPASTVQDPNLLVGIETNDDAAIYRINDEQALVLTTDFFPPIVDDAETFGKIATANALSDVYAKGARPISALSIVGFPASKLPLETLQRIMKGATEKCNDAGIIISGGHTIDDVEPKFGLAVTGMVHPARYFRNVGARPGDSLILTKAIGTGIVTTSMKKGFAPQATADAACASMMTLNKAAMEVLTRPEFAPHVHACTDVTGFGLLGHLRGMILGSHVSAQVSLFLLCARAVLAMILGSHVSAQVSLLPAAVHHNHVSAQVDFASVPQLPGAMELLRLRGPAAFSTGSVNNMGHVADVARYSDRLSTTDKQFVCDAQTSGGLLIALDGTDPALGRALVEALRQGGCPVSACIGSVVPASSGETRILVGLGDTAAFAQQNFAAFEMPTQPAPPREPYNIDRTNVWLYKNAIVTQGNEQLGAILAAGILGKLLTTPAPLPGTILFLGDGVELTTINDNTVTTLRELERRGVVVWSCSTCLNHLKLMDRLRVGRNVTADEVAELLASAPRVVSMS